MELIASLSSALLSLWIQHVSTQAKSKRFCIACQQVYRSFLKPALDLMESSCPCDYCVSISWPLNLDWNNEQPHVFQGHLILPPHVRENSIWRNAISKELLDVIVVYVYESHRGSKLDERCKEVHEGMRVCGWYAQGLSKYAFGVVIPALSRHKGEAGFLRWRTLIWDSTVPNRFIQPHQWSHPPTRLGVCGIWAQWAVKQTASGVYNYDMNNYM